MPRALPAIPNLRRLEIAVTVEIYSLLAESSDSAVDPDDLASALEGISSGLLPVFIDRARVHGFYSYDAEEGYYDLTGSGLDLLMEHGRSPNADIQAYIERGVPWVLESDLTDAGELSTQEDEWAPLPIDRGNEDFTEMLSAAEAALQQIEANNGYAATEPDQRNGIVFALRGAIETIKLGSPTISYVKASLISPLKFIARKFSEGVIGQVAKAAADAAIKWLTNF